MLVLVDGEETTCRGLYKNNVDTVWPRGLANGLVGLALLTCA